MRLLRWFLVVAVLYGMALNREPLRPRVQHARIAMTRLGPRLLYLDFGA
jgi:hypothetical protein